MEEQIRDWFENTQMYYVEMAKTLGVSQKVIITTVKRLFSEEQMRDRKRRSWSRSKLEGNNFMRGRTGEDHQNFKGRVGDGNGYIMVLKPEWYTGRKGSKHVFEHSVVMCEALGLTEIPAGFVVHHIDWDTTNNATNNLALLTSGAHKRLHNVLSLGRATTTRKGKGLVTPERTATIAS